MELYSGKKVLITGASGFIGSKLASYLVETGAKVYGISRSEQMPGVIENWFIGDLSDSKFVDQIISKLRPDYVFHLASHVLGARDYKYVQSTFEDNFLTTLNLLNAVHKYSCKRLIIGGSFEGSVELSSPIPSSPYAAAKIASASYSKMFHKLYNTPVVIASIYMVYGPGQKDLSKLVPYVILESLEGRSPKLTSGTRMVDWIYIDDVAKGLLKLGIAPDVEGRTIDLGSGSSISTKQIVNKIIELIGTDIVPQFGTVPDRPFEQERDANFKEALSYIDWSPETSLEKGLKVTIDFYAEMVE